MITDDKKTNTWKFVKCKQKLNVLFFVGIYEIIKLLYRVNFNCDEQYGSIIRKYMKNNKKSLLEKYLIKIHLKSKIYFQKFLFS